MYKLLWILLMLASWMYAHALQVDEESSMKALYHGKHAVNRAAHAAAQQVDAEALAAGRLRIDPDAALREAAFYLQANLELDEEGNPLPDSYWREKVEVLVFRVINDDVAFPYTYRNAAYDYEVTLDRPGVVLMIKLKYPRVFAAMPPVGWVVKGTAELVGF
ncbi:hypothetical protein [Paenibacillus methanolicus]|uniref:Uncharacterized protein n=1 Tax=Paenibacillus methanolicus TaxID=582686 RepID=A0A5S5BR65_9BACL|nr:hypothetical protein [Paenibacillus methanolicus]TYP68640.1 hypothetical protein BCM02_11837 [Paenibacillus methanolicus]